MEELRQNAATEITEKERWKRQCTELKEELEQVKINLDKEEKKSRALKKENAYVLILLT
jgi:hypothetical protein